MSASFDELWSALAPLGRDGTTGGYRRYSWGAADAEVRTWFVEAATAHGLDVRTDRNGNLWAWWGEPGGNAVVTGSHLDSVPDGGAFDGPLGIVTALAAVDELTRRGVRTQRPLAVTVFVEEEGARFGVPCLGSRLSTGTVTPERAASLTDADGVTWVRAMERAGLDPTGIGPDPELLQRVGVFVELHVEQGRALAPMGQPIGVASAVWPHGRWRMDFTGRADHAVLAARTLAEQHDAVATVGRVRVSPNGTNAIPSQVSAWLDARAPEEATLRSVFEGVTASARHHAATHAVDLTHGEESLTPVVDFPHQLRDHLASLVGGRSGPAPILPTGAGHDAGVLASIVPTAMLFVRNPSGVSHSPEEHTEPSDCHAGVTALTDVLADLLQDDQV